MNKPRNFEEFFEFYYMRYKPLYGLISSTAVMPSEVLLELNAAFDHLSRHWKYGEPEEQVVSLAAAHLKRGTFDIFKLILKETSDQYKSLRAVDTSIVDNGKFDIEMHELWCQIRDLGAKARSSEGDARDPKAWDVAFEKWEEVYVLCQRFEQEFFRSPHVEWARKRSERKNGFSRALELVLAVVAGLLANHLYNLVLNSF